MTARFCLSAILAAAVLLTACSGQKAKLPFGGVNAPANGRKASGNMELVGWALAEAGIDSVSVYVDRVFVSTCALGLPRPDVAQVYPNIGGRDNAGWKAVLDTTKFPPGWHEVVMQARSKDGATRDLASVSVLIER
jgi:hypothetical protein